MAVFVLMLLFGFKTKMAAVPFDHFWNADKIMNQKIITMKTRMNINTSEPGIYKAMNAAEKELSSFDLNTKLAELVKVRVSQLNGCGYCINMHSKDARKLGETEQRLYALSAWWETPFFTDQEQAALKLAEEVTFISSHGVSDAAYKEAIRLFGEKGVAQLIFTAIVTNSWNRLAISTHMIAEQGE